jgi:phosphoheptose isomerase
MKSLIEFEFNEHLKTSQATLEYIAEPLEVAANLCIDSLKNGKKDPNLWQWWQRC